MKAEINWHYIGDGVLPTEAGKEYIVAFENPKGEPYFICTRSFMLYGVSLEEAQEQFVTGTDSGCEVYAWAEVELPKKQQ